MNRVDTCHNSAFVGLTPHKYCHQTVTGCALKITADDCLGINIYLSITFAKLLSKLCVSDLLQRSTYFQGPDVRSS